jgi:hypothetical protein
VTVRQPNDTRGSGELSNDAVPGMASGLLLGGTMETTRTKVAWIRDANAPMGQPAGGHLNCPCGAKPRADKPEDYVPCVCGAVYAARGYVVNTRAVA